LADHIAEELSTYLKTAEVDTGLAKPKPYLMDWRDILITLGLTNNDEDKERVRNQNSRYEGPIIFPGQGASPKVDKIKLLEWWNALEIQWETGHSPARDAKPTTDDQYNYSRNGTVVPGISGEVKKRRGQNKKF
jgi:hypothetical protein